MKRHLKHLDMGEHAVENRERAVAGTPEGHAYVDEDTTHTEVRRRLSALIYFVIADAFFQDLRFEYVLSAGHIGMEGFDDIERTLFRL